MSRIPSLFLSLLVLSAGALSAQDVRPLSETSRLLPVSGVLTDTSGTAVKSGRQELTFSIFSDADGSSLLWTETQVVSSDGRGGYYAYLGTTTPLPLDIFRSEQARWLQVSSAGRVLQRSLLVAVPYALRAADAETLGGRPLSAFVTRRPDGAIERADGAAVEGLNVDGSGVPNQLARWTSGTTLSSSIITETSTSRIGVSTTDPTEGGLIDSKLTIRSSDGATALAVSNQAGTPRFALNVNSDGSWVTFDRAAGVYQPGIAQRNGRVGVSTTDPQGGGVVDSKFTVRNLDNNTGIAVLNESDGRRFALNTLANGGFTLYDGGSGAWTAGLSQRLGRVGLGTTNPSYKLHVVAGTLRGIYASTTVDFAVVGDTVGQSGTAVLGQAGSGTGVHAYSSSGTALVAESDSNATAIHVPVGKGKVGLGTPTPADLLDVRGDIRVGTGSTGCVKDADATIIAGTCSSDRRLKQDVVPFGRAIDAVGLLQPVHFSWRAGAFPERHFGSSPSYGLIAQDVERVLPGLVVTDEQGYKAVKYSALPMYMLQAIKDLKMENDALRRRLEEQEARLLRLERAAR